MDSDSDSEDFVYFGTPLEIIEEDEPLPKPISVQDQVVRDRQGRQRFHGAFTGGFSAGFFNTVGSKEGFTPSTFVSSRGKRADHHDHRPEDYMDEDDKGDYGIAPRKLVTSQSFAGEEMGAKKRPAPDSSIIPDDGRIQDIIIPTDETLGARLLRKMGWKPGQGVGPKMERKKKGKRKKKKGGGGGRVYGCARPPGHETQADDDEGAEDEKEDDDEVSDVDDDDDDFMRGFLFAPDDIQDFIFAPKDDQHGIGYRGMDSRSILGGHVTLFDEPVFKQNRRQGIKGHAFGIGAFEDEEENDVYSTDRMSNYDRVLGGEEETLEKRMYGWTGPPSKHSSDGDVLDGFKAACQRKISTKVFQPPSLPRDFRPFHHFQGSTVNTSDQSTKPGPPAHSRFTLSADQRAAMLGEEQLPGPASIDELLSSQDLALLKEARDKASTSQQSTSKHQSRWDRGAPNWSAPTQEATAHGGGSSFQPFARDAEKQRRYEQYLQNRHRGSETVAGDSRTEWEKQQEQEEFSRAASLYQKPMSGLMASRFVRAKHTDEDDTVEVPAETGGDEDDQRKAADMKMFGQLTRDTMEWHPDKLLCKRFNVADPYPGSSIIGLPTVKKDKFSVFNFLEIQQPNVQMDIYTIQPAVIPKEVEEQGPLSTSSTSASSLKRSRWDQHPGILASVGSKQEGKDAENQGTSKIPEYDVSSQDSPGDETRPPLDLFQAIFLDSGSSDSSSDEEDKDEEEDPKKSDGALGSEFHAIQGLESSRGGENPANNGRIAFSEENELPNSSMTRTKGFEDDQVIGKFGDDSQGNWIGLVSHKDGGQERDNNEEGSVDAVQSEEEEEEEEEEEYGPVLPPSLSYSQKCPKSNSESLPEERRSRVDREKRKEKRDKKRKKRKSEHKHRDRSRDQRKDKEKHDTESSSSRNKRHEKVKKSKHRHGERHKHSRHKSSKGRKKRQSSSTDYESGLSSDN